MRAPVSPYSVSLDRQTRVSMWGLYSIGRIIEAGFGVCWQASKIGISKQRTGQRDNEHHCQHCTMASAMHRPSGLKSASNSCTSIPFYPPLVCPFQIWASSEDKMIMWYNVTFWSPQTTTRGWSFPFGMCRHLMPLPEMLPCTWPCRISMKFQGHHGMPAFLQAERCQLIRKNDMNVIVGVQFFKTRSHVTVTLGNHLLSLKVLFTSGSTGKPKVVRASHTAVGDPSGQRFCRTQKLTSTCWYLLYHVIPIGWACHQANTANTFDFIWFPCFHHDFERFVTEFGQGHDSLVARCATSSASSNRCECLGNGFQLKMLQGGRILDAEVFFCSFVFRIPMFSRIQSLNFKL